MNYYKNFQLLAIVMVALSALVNCKQEPHKPVAKAEVETNQLLKEWMGPYGGVPAFDKVALADVKPAMLKGMEQSLKENQAIAENTQPATFENTIAAMERSGKALDRAFNYYGVLGSNMSTPAFREVQKELAPLFSEYQSKITQNEKLFARIKTVYDASQKVPLEAEQQRVVELTYKQFVMEGAALDADKKKQYAAINKELSSLYIQFSNNVLHDEENYITYLIKSQLGGLPEGFAKSAAKIASDKGQEGKYAITNTRSSMNPFLTYSTERELRKKVWTNYYARGDNGDAYDNNQLIAQILKLRRQRVNLLGHANYAEWRLQDRMAKTPENALNLMETVWKASIARVHEEVADMQAIANKKGDQLTIEPWDYRYYAEKVRKQKYDLNSDEVKQYLQLDKLTEAMHYVAGRLFNYKFTPVEEGKVSVFHEDVKVWEVTDKHTGKNIGLWYLDPYAREGKRSGAWATTYRSYASLDGETNVLASNNSNFVKPAPGEALLVS